MTLPKFSLLLLVGILITTEFTPFISSWLPSIGAFPAGSVMRDLFIMILVVYTLQYLLITRIHLPIMFLILFLVFNTMFVTVLTFASVNFRAAVFGARNLIFPFIVGLSVSANIMYGGMKYDSLKRVIYILGIIGAVLGIMDVISNGTILNALGYRVDYTNLGKDKVSFIVGFLGIRRASGGLGDALNYGYTMALFSVYALSQLLMLTQNKENKRNRNILYILFILGSVAVVLSLTRGAILVLAMGIILFLKKFFSARRRLVTLVIFGCSVYLFISYIGLGTVLYERILQKDVLSAASSSLRLEMAGNSIKAILKEPLGIGLGTQGAGIRYSSKEIIVNTDSYFFTLGLEAGILGFVFLSLFALANLFQFFKYSYKSITKNCRLSVFLVLTYLISGILASSLISPLFAIFFWTIVNTELAITMKSYYIKH